MYRLKEEHKKLIPEHNKFWIDNALSNEQTTEESRNLIKKYVKELYEVSGLDAPPEHRIIFVSSPLVARLVGGFASWIWHCRKNNSAPDEEADDATRDATYDATDKATYKATYAATYDATRAATNDAMYEATDAATDKENNKWYYIKGGIKSLNKIASVFGNPKTLLKCAYFSFKMYQGGNFWSGTSSFVTFGRYIAKLDIDYSKWNCYEQLSKLSSYRIMHKKFCIISERPIKMKVDLNNRPHCEDGPYCEWKDGFALYCLNGIRVPKWLVETPAEKIDPILALTEKNVDVQREIIRKVGADRVLKASNAEEIDVYTDGKTNLTYKLMRMKIGDSIDRMYLYFEHASMKGIYYAQPVPPETRKALHGYAYQRKMVTRENLDNIDAVKEAEIIANLPSTVQ